jgi:hypothetical protein
MSNITAVLIISVNIFAFAINAIDVRNATVLSGIQFSRWNAIVIIVPIFHMVFGVLLLFKKMFSKNEHVVAFLTVQMVITGSIIVVWLIWAITLFTKSTGASNGFLLGISITLEGHVYTLSKRVEQQLEDKINPLGRKRTLLNS